jgi:hypothetical protein
MMLTISAPPMMRQNTQLKFRLSSTNPPVLGFLVHNGVNVPCKRYAPG